MTRREIILVGFGLIAAVWICALVAQMLRAERETEHARKERDACIRETIAKPPPIMGVCI